MCIRDRSRTVGQKAFVTRSEGPVAFNLRLERETALYGSTEAVLELSLIHISEPTRPY